MNATRKEFLAGGAALAAVGCTSLPTAKRKPGELAWCMYQQLGYHMWASNVKAPFAENGHYCGEETSIDDESWENRMLAAKKNGCNMLCIDLAEGLIYPSHPELAVKGSRSAEWMNERVRKLRYMGIEAIPQLNLSGAHHFWLGQYSRMVSTPEYYKVVKDLFADVYDIFEKPSMMGMGMDEENSDCVKRSHHAIYRLKDLLWHDIDFFAKTISAHGARPWMWADYEWWKPAEYPKKVSKEIVQSNWYYGGNFDYKNMQKGRTYVESFVRLNAAGFDQILGCSNWVESWDPTVETINGKKVNRKNIPGTVEFALKNIDKKHLLGFYCMPWVSTSKKSDPTWIDAAEQLGAAKAKYFAS